MLLDTAEMEERIAKKVVEELKPLLGHKCKNSAEDTIFDVKTLSEYLKVDTSWIYKQIHNGKLPFVKAGKYGRFKKSAIDKWLESNSTKPDFL